MAWISPTGHEPFSGWSSEARVYDGNTNSYAAYNVNSLSWSPSLVLTIASTTSSKLRFNALYSARNINKIEIAVLKVPSWILVYAGSYADHVWVEKTFLIGQVTKISARFYNADPIRSVLARWYECELWRVPAAKGAMQTGKYWGEPI